MTYPQLGHLIKMEREKRDWEQLELARKLNVGQQTVSRWEKGGSRPKMNDLLKLVDLFYGDVEEWMGKAGYQIQSPDMSLLPFLPLQRLSAENFELFCKDLVRYKNPTADVQRYGVPGDIQDGIDIYAKYRDGKVFDYQCKRHEQFGPVDIDAAVKATTFESSHHTLLLTRRATRLARLEMNKHNNWTLWDLEDVSTEVRSLPKDEAVRLVDNYFPGFRKRFLGIEEKTAWLTREEFFEPLLNKQRLFSHGWDFVGRENEINLLKDFEKQKEFTALIVSGRGGIGKSRLLKKWVDGLSSQTKVRFVSPGYDINQGQLDLLPDGPSYLVIDDAHDRSDIPTIVNGVSRFKPETKIIVTTRPYGVKRLEDEFTQTGISFDREKVVTLTDLELKDAKALSEQIFNTVSNGENIEHSERIAEITKDCPLATVVGSQLVAKGDIRPELLSNDEDFREELMRSFRKVVTGQFGGSSPENIQDLLNLVATVQPINSIDPKFQDLATKILERKFDRVLRDLDVLEEAGILLRRGNRLRVVPDLLADFIRADVAFNKKSKLPTGYADQVFNASQDSLATNLLVNISQLDWRLSADGLQSSLLNEVWNNLKSQFRNAKIFERTAILDMLEKVAYFQPAEALSFIRLALNEPTEEFEKEQAPLAFAVPEYQTVINKVPPILKYVAYHEDYLIESLDILRSLAEVDKRPTNRHPEHPIRILQDLASIEPGKPVKYIEIIVDHVLGWLQSSRMGEFSPFDVIDEVLETQGHTSETRGITITYNTFKIRLEAVENIRKDVVDAAFQILENSPLKDGLRALKTIEQALRFPPDTSKEERNKWEPGILEILKLLEKVVVNPELDPAISTEIRGAVSWHHRFSESLTNTASEKVIANIPLTLPYEISRAIIDGWGWTFEREDDQGISSSSAISTWRKRLSHAVIEQYKSDFGSLIKYLEERVLTIGPVFGGRHPDAGAFLASLMEEDPAFALLLGEYLLSNTDSPLVPWFNVVTIVISKHDHKKAVDFFREALKKEKPIFTQCVAGAIGRGLTETPITDEEVELFKQLAANNDFWVRKTAVSAVKRFSSEKKAIALQILLSIDLSESKELADEIAGEFDEKYGSFNVNELTDAQIDQFLKNLVNTPSIDDYRINRLLSKLSFSHPHEVLKLLMDRVEKKESGSAIKGYDVLPYEGNNDEPYHFSDAKDYESLLRSVRDWATENPDNWVRFHYGTELFKSISGYDKTTLKVLQEWISSGDEKKLEFAAALLSGSGNDFVWNNEAFVANLLDEAQKYGNACYRRAASPLYTSVIQGGKSGTPGEPFPEDLKQRDKSFEAMARLPIGSPAYRFYKMLNDAAKLEIARHTNEDFEFE